MESEEDVLSQIRDEFFLQYSQSDFDERDLKRLKDAYDWLYAFYLHSKKSPNLTLQNLNEVLRWRKEFEANDLVQDEYLPFPENALTKGGVFLRNKDVNDITILHIKVKLYEKGEYPLSDVFKFVAYHFEKSYKFNSDYQIVLLFDMQHSGTNNYDLEMIRFTITCLKKYYPRLAAYVMVYEAPFIFQMFWRIIKMWLDVETVDKIKFVNRNSIHEYVEPDQLLTHMGGYDDYRYTYTSQINKERTI